MKRLSSWIGAGVVALAASSASSACGGDDDGNGNGGRGGTAVILDGSSGKGGGFGSGGTGGSSSSSKLGSSCAKDEDCGAPLQCVTAGSGKFGGEGPAGGYCSLPCGGGRDAGTDLCQSIEPNSVCVNMGGAVGGALWCILGCQFGPASLPDFNPDKCHARSDVACTPIGSPTGDTCDANTGTGCANGQVCDSGGNCEAVLPLCLPRCNANADCGPGLFCGPDTGQCSPIDTTPGKKKIGAECSVDEECQGSCQIAAFVGTAETKICTQNCTLGASATCGWAGPSTAEKAEAACLFWPSVINADLEPSRGDIGICAPLCDCNKDCHGAGIICLQWNSSLKRQYRRNGVCIEQGEGDAGLGEGIPSCTPVDGGTGGTGGTGTGGSGGVKDAGPG
jgi:hypothetical protein